MGGNVLHRRIAVVATVVAMVVLIGLVFAWWRSPARRTRVLLRECREVVAQQVPSLSTEPGRAFKIGSVGRKSLSRSGWTVRRTAAYLDQCRASDVGKALFGRLGPEQIEQVVDKSASFFDPKDRYDYMDRVWMTAGPVKGKCYVCIAPPPSPLKQEDMPPNPKWWRESPRSGEVAQAVLDAWGNPVVLVPGAGLWQLKVDKDEKVTVRSLDGQFFFASAGPDGDFTTLDDNVYSFD